MHRLCAKRRKVLPCGAAQPFEETSFPVALFLRGMGARQWREKANLVYARRENGMLLASCAGEQGVAFVCAPSHEGSSTCSRAEFFGQGNGGEIAALAGGELSGKASGSLDACAALRVPVTVEAGERVCVDFLLGWAENPAAARMKADSFVGRGGGSGSGPSAREVAGTAGRFTGAHRGPGL